MCGFLRRPVCIEITIKLSGKPLASFRKVLPNPQVKWRRQPHTFAKNANVWGTRQRKLMKPLAVGCRVATAHTPYLSMKRKSLEHWKGPTSRKRTREVGHPPRKRLTELGFKI